MSIASTHLGRLIPSTSTACYLCARHSAKCAAKAGHVGFSSSIPNTAQTVFITQRSLSTTKPTPNDSLEDIVADAERAEDRRIARKSRKDLPCVLVRFIPPLLADQSVNSSQAFVQRPKPAWQLHKEAMKEAFPEGWSPPKKVGRAEMQVMRKLRALPGAGWTADTLADRFKISPEAVRRILKSNWRRGDDPAEVGPFQAPEVADTRLRSWVNGSSPDSGQRMQQEATDADSPPSAVPLRATFKLDKASRRYKWARRTPGQLML